MLTTNNSEWAKKARYLSTQARQPALHYEHTEAGYNYRLSNISAAIGIGQMHVLSERIKRRREIFYQYKKNLESEKIQFMPEPKDCFNNCWLSSIVLKNYNYEKIQHLVKNLEGKNIETRPLWKPLHLQPLFKGCSYFGNGLSEQLFEQGLCIPSSSSLTNEEVNIVCETLAETI
jgi:dTDP-4-amino-4,6-dideoxygalactose transaminase